MKLYNGLFCTVTTNKYGRQLSDVDRFDRTQSDKGEMEQREVTHQIW